MSECGVSDFDTLLIRQAEAEFSLKSTVMVSVLEDALLDKAN